VQALQIRKVSLTIKGKGIKKTSINHHLRLDVKIGGIIGLHRFPFFDKLHFAITFLFVYFYSK